MKVVYIILVFSLAALSCLGEEELSARAEQSRSIWRSDPDWFPMGGIKYDSVTGLTGSGCILVPVNDPFERPNEFGIWTCNHTLFFLQVEGGEGGGKLQCGYGAWYMIGWAAKLSILRTWGETLELEPEQTYLGGELQLNCFLLNSSVGFYSELDGDGEDETLVTLSAGIGF